MTEKVLRAKDLIEDYLTLKGVDFESKTEIDVNTGGYIISFITEYGWGFISDANLDKIYYVAFDHLKSEKAENDEIENDGKFYVYLPAIEFLFFLTSGKIFY